MDNILWLLSVLEKDCSKKLCEIDRNKIKVIKTETSRTDQNEPLINH